MGLSSFFQPLLAPKSANYHEIPRVFELIEFIESRSSKVIILGVNRKHICDFLSIVKNQSGAMGLLYGENCKVLTTTVFE